MSYIRELTKKEVEEGRIRREELKKGTFKERMMAVLMDSSLGGSGMHEAYADGKADALIGFLIEEGVIDD